MPLRAIFALLAIASLAACGRAGEELGGDASAVRVAILSPEPPAALQRAWGPVIADMDAATGLTVRPVFTDDAGSLANGFRDRRYDIGLLTNQAALEVERRAGAEVFARTTEPGGGEGYHSVLIVAARSRLTLDRVMKCDRTLSLGMGEPLSTAGALAPETYLFAPRGLSPAQCFKAVRRASPHANLLAVASGQLDVATNDSTALDTDRQKGRWEAGQVRVIWRSPVLPEYPVVWRRDLDPAVKEKLRQFLLTYGQGDQPGAGAARARLARLDLGVFEPADDTHLLPAKEMEATRAWLQARAGGDRRKEEIARRALDAVTAQRQALEARTGAPAAAQ